MKTQATKPRATPEHLAQHFYKTVNADKYERALRRERKLSDHKRDRMKSIQSRLKKKDLRYGLTSLIQQEA